LRIEYGERMKRSVTIVTTKVIKGNKVPVVEEEIVDYIIDGILSKTLRNQAKMHSFSTV